MPWNAIARSTCERDICNAHGRCEFGPLIALLPFIGDGLARGQPVAVLLFLIVLSFALYVENCVASAAFAFSLAITLKVFPLVLAVIPFLRRDWKFMVWAAGWCIILLLGLPAICLGPRATIELYRTMFTEHLGGIISGAMSTMIASQISPGAYSSIGVGSVLARGLPGKHSIRRRCRNGRPPFNFCSMSLLS